MSLSVLVTGATGYIGRNLVSFLLENGFTVNVIVRPESKLSVLEKSNRLIIHTYNNEYAEMKKIMTSSKPEVVFHLAAMSTYQHVEENLDAMLEANLKLGLHLLEAMDQAGCRKLINTGSYWQSFEDADYSPTCLYAAMKQAFEDLLQYYVECRHFFSVTLRLYDVYGPNDTRDKLFNLLYKAAISGKAIDMSPGGQILNLVHINDVIEAYRIALNRIMASTKETHEKFFIYGDENILLKKVVQTYQDSLGKKVPINWGAKPYRQREVMQPFIKGERLASWKPKILLHEGLAGLISSQLAMDRN